LMGKVKLHKMELMKTNRRKKEMVSLRPMKPLLCLMTRKLIWLRLIILPKITQKMSSLVHLLKPKQLQVTLKMGLRMTLLWTKRRKIKLII